MGILTNKKTRALIIIMIALVISGILIAKIYYGSENNSVDPRVVPARELYAKYDEYAREGDYHKIFSLLDSVEMIYSSYSHYKNSFEMGVLHNNRAAALITIALYSDSIDAGFNPFYGSHPDTVMKLAGSELDRAIDIYDEWLEDYSDKSEEGISEIIDTEFRKDLDADEAQLIEKYRDARSREIVMAVKETGRRLSVCYTNLGVIKRYNEEYEEAVRCYQKALELWDRNLSAENNLNALLGRPLKKRNFIQKMFPPER